METNYNNMMIALDGSEQADIAFKKGIEMAKRHHATLYLIHVVDSSPYRGIAMYDINFTKKMLKQADVLLNKYKKQAENDGIEDVQIIVKEGSPKSIITKSLTSELQIDIVICGAKGVNAVERMFMGSVSEHIVRQADCDVLVVRNKNNAVKY